MQLRSFRVAISANNLETCSMSLWGIDIMGPLPPGKKQLKFLVVAINYFTKWVEAEPLVVITEAKIQHFIWKNLVCRFGIPQVIISNRQMARHPQARSWG